MIFSNEAFELIEQRKEEGVTPDYLAKRLGITPRSAASWLSKWTRRDFLKYLPFDGGGVDKISELEELERAGTLTYADEERLKVLRNWRATNRGGPRGVGRPPSSQGRYILGLREWGTYRYGKLEERMAIRDGVKKW
jgi:hypothetical protein